MKCKQHPKYQVKRKPRLACEACWAMWLINIGLVEEKVDRWGDAY